ncbi:hypothetical protein Fleli_1733 [Bernardetia litoralis DSM 6794]|uniref:Lipocalin-like domain-containing protein n=1 Tax=Bernardetia litoralis (strain ATCC 23117 / DSM 6794 / NBRC 15988 / NCIMB 1366 / Fx l1 / Sio-4) TaxID=880071 RepID=I4AJJ8_BERLS|nr:hypothetical protein [Bernardetia litoralis]AFM04133.1 hypothetical protein Fleli_1733 [Bernardetia litoralis DSM 6794]
MKKNTLIILILSWFLIPMAFSQNNDCQSFRIGRFSLSDTTYNKEYLIVRNDSLQIETDLETGYVSTYKLIWESDCKYVLTVIDGQKDVMEFYKDRKLSIEIIELYADSYKFSAQVEGLDMVFYQIVKRAK